MEDGTLIEYIGRGNHVKIPYGVTTIGELAFLRTSTAYVTVPDTVTRIESAAFVLSRLEEIYLPEEGKLEFMGTGVFAETPYYNRIAEGREDFVIFYDHLLAYNGQAAVVTVPASVTAIDDNAFADHHEIRRVVLLEALVSIGSSAFKGCTNLTELTILGDVVSVKADAFEATPWIKTQKRDDYTIVFFGTKTTKITRRTLSKNIFSKGAMKAVIWPGEIY